MQAKKNIFITGTSSGIGHYLSLKLAQNGYNVYAGVRTQKDAQVLLDHSKQINPVIVDVTQAQQIEQAYQQIKAHLNGRGLDALINNAAISRLGPLEFLNFDDLRSIFEVNLFGVMAVTQKFLPLLRSEGGRIINMGSMAGILTMPFASAYSASKHALEAISDGLRRELKFSNVKVIHFQISAIGDKWERINKNLLTSATSNEAVREYYDDYLQRYVKNILKNNDPSAIQSPEVVFQKLKHALTSDNPKIRYSMGRKHLEAKLFSLLPYRWQDWLIFKMHNK